MLACLAVHINLFANGISAPNQLKKLFAPTMQSTAGGVGNCLYSFW